MNPRTPEGGQATNRVTWLKRNILLSHTPLSRTSVQRGNVVTEKGISKLENLGISKF